ncbi:hypothetical protein DFH29DRAFT_966136, partial [Suillus ampliporus]
MACSFYALGLLLAYSERRPPTLGDQHFSFHASLSFPAFHFFLQGSPVLHRCIVFPICSATFLIHLLSPYVDTVARFMGHGHIAFIVFQYIHALLNSVLVQLVSTSLVQVCTTEDSSLFNDA